MLRAETALLLVAAVLVDDENVRPQPLHRGHEVHHAAAGVDEGILDIADALDHEKPLLLAVDGLVVLVSEDSGVGADADIEVAVFRRLAEELHVTAVEQVIATADEDFFLFAHDTNVINRRQFHKPCGILVFRKRYLPLHPCSKSKPGLTINGLWLYAL